jgi:hypothetical protein
MTGSIQIEVSLTRAPLDEPVAIRVVGGEPGRRITLRAEMFDHMARRWSSHGEFTADERGVIDLVRDAPVSGTYEGVDNVMVASGGTSQATAFAPADSWLRIVRFLAESLESPPA